MDYNAEETTDWHERTVIIWMEDDAPVPDKEKVEAAWKRIRGCDLNSNSYKCKVLKKLEDGDTFIKLYPHGWVIFTCCEGSGIGIVVKENQ